MASGQPSWATWRSWAVVTAYNPHGQRVNAAQNQRADAELQRTLRLLGMLATPVVNGEGDWAEPAWLLRDPRLKEVAQLGRQCAQAAVLWGVGRRVALVECHPPRVRRFWVALAAPG